MASSTPLQGSELIDCARANSKQGMAIAAQNCGYGNDLDTFDEAVKKAGQAIGIEIKQFSDLIEGKETLIEPGIEIAPDTPGQL
jgi:hypothetical protein